MPTTIVSDASGTARWGHRRIDKTSNGVLWAMYDFGSGVSSSVTRFAYSTNNGSSWTAALGPAHTGTTRNYTPWAAFFIDLDDYAHLVYKDQTNGYIYYRRGTPNGARTSWTWSGSTQLFSAWTGFEYPDIVAHREGTGWAVHVVISNYESGGAYNARYARVPISSAGVVGTLVNETLPSAMQANAHSWPSIDFNHTGDGKTVKNGTPNLYVVWSAGVSGSGKGVRYRSAAYSAGSWTWGTEVEIDSTLYVATDLYFVNALWDGTSKVYITAHLYNSTSGQTYQRIYERDVVANTTTTRIISGESPSLTWSFGTSSIRGNKIYIIGRDGVGSPGTFTLKCFVWDISTNSISSTLNIDTSANSPYVSARRGSSSDTLDFVHLDGTSAPYTLTFERVSIPSAPTNVTTTPLGSGKATVSWTHNDVDGSPQSKYQIRWRKI